MRTKKVFVGGISGCGKSTVLDNLIRVYSGVEIIHGSKHFMEWLGIKNYNYRELELLPNNFKNKETDKMIRFLLRRISSENEWFLLDAHYLRISNGKVTNAVGSWLSLFDALFLVVARPEIILRRINNDSKNRNRNIFNKGSSEASKLIQIQKFSDETLDKMKYLSKKFKIPYFIINNNTSIEKTLLDFINCLNKV